MAFHLAWRILTHEKLRTVLATAGIFVAILLVFIELGFFVAVPQGGMLINDYTGRRIIEVDTKGKVVTQWRTGSRTIASIDLVR